MELEIVRADPAGNITVFVLNPPASKRERESAVKALLADSDLKAEQVGFVLPSAESGAPWRLEMAGGEFCGNASRSLALLAAAKTGLAGKHTLTIEVSGMTKPLPVHIDTEAQTAGIELPPPLEESIIVLNELKLPVYVFEGITHIIAENMRPDEQTVRELIKITDKSVPAKQPALGVMFYDSEKRFMRPLIWTRAIDSMVFESSCGSGSAALGIWAARNAEDAELEIDLAQPGGTITVIIVKRAGKIRRLSVSGKVTLSGIFRFRC